MTLSWNEYYEMLKDIKKNNGTINLPIKFEYNGVPVGRWLSRQRNRKQKGILSTERIALLEELDIEWNLNNIIKQKNDAYWDKCFELAKQYYEEHGNLLIPVSYSVEDINLGVWLRGQKGAYRGNNRRKITKEHIAQLESIGIVWDYNEVVEDNWNAMYEIAKQYYAKYGDIHIPQGKKYKKHELGSWIHTQRRKRVEGLLAEERIEKLDLLGIRWNPENDRWEEYYQVAKKFYEQIGNLNIPGSYCIDGLQLGRWISVQRQAYNGREDCNLDDTQISRLEEIGMLWEVSSGFQTSFNEQAIYYYVTQLYPNAINRYSELGVELDIFIPELKVGIEYDGEYWHRNKYDIDNQKDAICNENNITLIRIREAGLNKTLGADNYILCDATIISFEKVLRDIFIKYFNSNISIDINRDSSMIIEYKNQVNNPWYINYNKAKKYYETHGNLDVVKSYRTEDGFDLSQWLAYQRQSRKGNNSAVLTDEQIRMLDEIGMIWDKNDFKWEKGFKIAYDYYQEYHTLEVKQDLIYEGYNLGKWINMQRVAYNSESKRKSLSLSQIKKLEKIGMVWNADELYWNRAFECAKNFYEQNGHLRIEEDYIVDDFALGLWIQSQRRLKKTSTTEMTLLKIKKLDSIGMIWDVKDYIWENNVRLSKMYLEQNGDLLIPQDYIVEGVRLGQWIGNLRNSRKGHGSIELTTERINLLNSLGMVWDVNEYLWRQQYLLAEKYYKENANLRIPVGYISNGYKLGSWLKNQKAAQKRGILSIERIKLLEQIGIEWYKK